VKKKEKEIEEMEAIVNEDEVVEIEAEVELEEVKLGPKPEKALYYENLFGGKK